MKKLILLLIVLIVLAFLMIGFRNNASTSLVTALPSATPITQSSEVRSLEGDNKLNMTTRLNTNGTTQYKFLVTDSSGKTTQLFTKTVAKGEEMVIAHNSWSPNNKYVFIEDRRGSVIDYLLFKANGELFTNNQSYLNVTALFNEKVKNYNLKAVTGWDDPVLMHVQTYNGPPFWFDLITQSFIQLAR